MPHRFDPGMKDRLESPERRQRLDPDRVLDLLPLDPSQTVADVGCGTGYFTIPLARRLTAGRVLAVDVSEEMLDTVREKLASGEIQNVDLVRVDEDPDLRRLPIPQDRLDGALLSFVLHEVEQQEIFLRTLRDFVRMGGWLAVIEWYRKPTEHGPPLEERLDPVEVKRLAHLVGLITVREQDLNGEHYLLLFQRVYR